MLTPTMTMPTTTDGSASVTARRLGLVLLLIPRTAPLGALLWTGYLGGAVATHVRIGNPVFSHILFPVYIAIFIWGGLYLRDMRVRTLVQSIVR